MIFTIHIDFLEERGVKNAEEKDSSSFRGKFHRV